MPSLAPALSRALPFYYGWIVLAVGFVTLGMGAGTRALFSLLFPPIIAEFGWERGLTASVFSVGFMVAAVIFPVIGAWIDRYGPERILPLGILTVAAGLWLTTMASTPLQFYLTLGIMVVGASTSFAYNGHFVFLPSWFERRRGLAIGIVSAGAGAISIVIVPQVQQLIDHGGWRTGCIMMAIALVLIALPLNVALQRRRPEELGLAPDGTSARTGTAAGPTVHVVDPAWAATDWTLARAMRTARFWYFSFGFFLGLFAWYAILVHQTKYLLDLGFNSTFAAWALGLVPMAGVGGQLLLGYLSDRIGREWVWTFACSGFLICYACMFLLARHPQASLVWVMVFAQGFLGYGLTPAIGAIPADLFQGRHYGRIFGVAAIFGSGGAAVGPWAFGILYDRTGSYDAACLLAMLLCTLSVILIWLSAPRRVRTTRRAAGT